MKKKEKISTLADGEYRLGRPYWALSYELILCRIFSSCEAVRRELLKMDRQAREERWTTFMHGFVECQVNKNVICSLDIAGLTGRRHDSVLRFMDRRKERSGAASLCGRNGRRIIWTPCEPYTGRKFGCHL